MRLRSDRDFALFDDLDAVSTGEIAEYGDDMPDELPQPDPSYSPDGVPTFDSVREKIENRAATALGAAELAAETAEGRSIEQQYDDRQRAAAEKLAQIRASMKSAD